MPLTIVNDGRKLHYTISHADGPNRATIIFVHGLGSSQNFYFPILPHLKEYRCITFDSYGAGRSPFNGQGTSVEQIGQDVLALLDEFKVQRAVVVGHSMGGMVPSYLASTAPERVLAGVCLGPVSPSPAVAQVFKERIPKVKYGGMEVMANMVPFSALGSGASEVSRAFVRELLLASEPDGYSANCKAIEMATAPDYKAVRCPMLVVAGKEDKTVPLSACEAVFGELGSKEGEKKLEVLNGVGHWHCVEDSEAVGKVLRAFVNGLAV